VTSAGDSENRFSTCDSLSTKPGTAAPEATAPAYRVSQVDGLILGAPETRKQRKYTGSLEEFSVALPRILQCSASARGLSAHDYSKEADYIVSRVRGCSGPAPLDPNSCPLPSGLGIEPVSSRVRTFDRRKERGLAMAIRPVEQWGDGRGLVVSVLFTQLPSDPTVRLNEISDAYSIVDAVVGESTSASHHAPGPLETVPRPTYGPAPGHLITDSYHRTLDIIQKNRGNGTPDVYSGLIALFLPHTTCMPTTRDGADMSRPNWTCEPGPGFRMPGDLVLPDGFWDKTGPASYLNACRTTPGQKWWMVEAGVVDQPADKKFLVPCAAIFALAGRREDLIQRTTVKEKEMTPLIVAGVAVILLALALSSADNAPVSSKDRQFQDSQPVTNWRQNHDLLCASAAWGDLMAGAPSSKSSFTGVLGGLVKCP
jgi:hypothetical protein